MRQSKKIEYKGETHTIKEWSEITGIPYPTIIGRLNLGWTASQVLGYEKHCFVVEYRGETHTIPEWAKITGINGGTIRTRIIEFNWPIGQALGYEEHNNSKYRYIGKIEYKGETHSIYEWSKITGIGGSTIHARITKLGWPIGQALGFEKR